MLKTTGLLGKPAFIRNNCSKPAFKRNDSNDEINKFGIGDNSIEYAKNLGKLKGQKLSKSQKLISKKLANSEKTVKK